MDAISTQALQAAVPQGVAQGAIAATNPSYTLQAKGLSPTEPYPQTVVQTSLVTPPDEFERKVSYIERVLRMAKEMEQTGSKDTLDVARKLRRAAGRIAVGIG